MSILRPVNRPKLQTRHSPTIFSKLLKVLLILGEPAKVIKCEGHIDRITIPRRISIPVLVNEGNLIPIQRIVGRRNIYPIHPHAENFPYEAYRQISSNHPTSPSSDDRKCVGSPIPCGNLLVKPRIVPRGIKPKYPRSAVHHQPGLNEFLELSINRRIHEELIGHLVLGLVAKLLERQLDIPKRQVLLRYA